MRCATEKNEEYCRRHLLSRHRHDVCSPNRDVKLWAVAHHFMLLTNNVVCDQSNHVNVGCELHPSRSNAFVGGNK